jgi:hypothetical protein
MRLGKNERAMLPRYAAMAIGIRGCGWICDTATAHALDSANQLCAHMGRLTSLAALGRNLGGR